MPTSPPASPEKTETSKPAVKSTTATKLPVSKAKAVVEDPVEEASNTWYDFFKPAPVQKKPKLATQPVAKLGERKIQECIDTLKTSSWFMFCSEETLREVALKMHKESFRMGDTIVHEGEPQERMWVVSKGSVDRLRTIDGRQHLMEVDEHGSTVGALYIMNRDPAYSDAVCRTPVTCYSITHDALIPMFENPRFAREVAYNLNLEIRRGVVVAAEIGRSPLLEQDQRPTPFLAVSIAAAIESFYRSGLNAMINAALQGHSLSSKAMFPQMHIQVPTRVLYINGFKGLRQLVDDSTIMREADLYSNPTLLRLAAAIMPGVVMTPVSSVLEAVSARGTNDEKLSRRWMRGYLPRMAREVIFGVGINQLSDYCEERLGFIGNKYMRTAAASCVAGVVAGYLSHLPHVFSTLKILKPSVSYRQHAKEYFKQAENAIPADIVGRTRQFLAYPMGILFPRGLVLRTSQIVGSFIILNGTINALQEGTGVLKKSLRPEGGIENDELLVSARADLMRRVKLERLKDMSKAQSASAKPPSL